MDNCKDVKNSYGKLLGYEVENNIVNIEFEEEKVYIKIVNSYIINFFVPSFRKERNSKAVENLKDKNCDFEVEFINGGIQISTEQLQLKVYDCFKVDIYDKEGTRLCADYRGDSKPFNRRYGDYMLAEAEGHAINNQEEYKLYISKNMEEEMYFYGLGEKLDI